MDSAAALRSARSQAGLTQRQLGTLAGIPQPTIARIETGVETPRVSTLSRLLSHCQASLVVAWQPGAGVDRTMIRELLRLTPAERLERAVADARGLEAFPARLRHRR